MLDDPRTGMYLMGVIAFIISSWTFIDMLIDTVSDLRRWK